jgi:hypothetical protein
MKKAAKKWAKPKVVRWTIEPQWPLKASGK